MEWKKWLELKDSSLAILLSSLPLNLLKEKTIKHNLFASILLNESFSMIDQIIYSVYNTFFPVFLLHCWIEYSTSWQDVISGLLSKTYNIMAFTNKLQKKKKKLVYLGNSYIMFKRSINIWRGRTYKLYGKEAGRFCKPWLVTDSVYWILSLNSTNVLFCRTSSLAQLQYPIYLQHSPCT